MGQIQWSLDKAMFVRTIFRLMIVIFEVQFGSSPQLEQQLHDIKEDAIHGVY